MKFDIILGLIILTFVVFIIRHFHYTLKLRNFGKANGCKPVIRWPLKDPLLGLDYWWALNQAAKRRRLLDWIRHQYDKYGTTYYTRLHITNVISTCDPENLKAMHTTRFEDFAVDNRRELAFLPLLGRHSVLLANGHEWEQKRAMLRPSFSKEQYTNTLLYERHVSRLIGNVKSAPECKIDLARQFLCLTVDITSEVMFDKSIELLKDDKYGLLDNMTNSAEGGHAAWLLVWLTKFVRQPVYHNSVKHVRKFMQRYVVDDAIAYRNKVAMGGHTDFKVNKSLPRQENSRLPRPIYLEAVAKATDDPTVMLDELTTILFAGRDTTAALMTNLFFLISRHPHVWTRIRADVAFLEGSKPTHEQLKGMDYLQACLKETLRLLPVIPLNTRMAIRDTVLPRGGGPDGQSPIVVPAGTNIAFHVTALHRRPGLWGDDAEEYKPERWESMKANWVCNVLALLKSIPPSFTDTFTLADLTSHISLLLMCSLGVSTDHRESNLQKYQPFGMGPRNCPGQHLSLAEAAYTTCRLAQEFKEVKPLEYGPWEELISLICTSASGAQVQMVPA